MSSKRDYIKLLKERRDKLRGEHEAIRVRLDEVEGLLRDAEGGSPEPVVEHRSRRGDVKGIVLSLFDEAGEAGLSSHGCVTWAREKRGVELQQASVSSLLSRLKADDVLFYDGERYRLKKYAGPRGPVVKGAM
jgi:hypothetical protein